MFKMLRKTAITPLNTPQALAAAIGTEYGSYAGQRVTTQRALQLSTVFSCVRVLAESVGMLPCKLYKRSGRGREQVEDHPVARLLSIAPNDYMTAQEHWEMLVACLALRGNYYAYKVHGIGGKVAELLPLDPGCVVPKLTEDWQLVYEVTWRDGRRETLGQDKIWHVRLLTLDGFTGLNPVAYARQAIALGLSTEAHGAQLFANGAVTSGVLSTEQKLTDEAFGRLKKQFNEEHSGLTNAHKPMVLEMGLSWKPVSLNMEDSQFLETRKYQRSEIAGLFRVPPHMIGDLERGTFTNIEHQGGEFLTNALVPILTRIESRARVGLLTDADRPIYYAKFTTGALVRGDLKTRMEAYGKGIQWGMYSPNDCLEMEDMNPREGGDVYLTPMNMTTNPEANDGNQKT